MNKRFLVFVLGGCLVLTSCSDGKNKAAEASKAALESIGSDADASKQSETTIQQQEQPDVDSVAAVVENSQEVEQVEPVQAQQEAVEENFQEIVEESSQSIVSNSFSDENAASSADLSSLSEKLGFQVTSDDDLELFQEIASWLGAPYLAAGNDKSGVDCSGLICKVFEKMYSKKLPRRSTDMYDQCEAISVTNAKAGDLVFFRPDGNMNEKPNYVGIYLKNNSFVIVSSSKGVTIADLSSNYYKKTFVTAGKVKY